MEAFREKGWPILYPHVAPKQAYDAGRLGAKVPAIMDIPAKGYEFVAEVAPAEGDVLVPKIAGVKVMAEPSDTAKVIGTLSRADELVAVGPSRDGFINVQGASGTGWVKIVLVSKR